MAETGLFRTQLANGIMGLASTTNSKLTKPNFIDALFSSQKSKSKNFSMCLGTNGGYLTFGGYNANKHIAGEKIQTTKYTKNYMVPITSIGVNAAPNWKFKKPVLAMLDSGTTFTYLRKDAFNYIRANFNSFCKLKSATPFRLCGGSPVYTDTWTPYCAVYKQSEYLNLNNFFNSFPRLYMNIGNNVKVVWFPKDYLLYNKTISPGVESFCTSIRKSPSNRPNSTLGNSFFRHYDIFFDRDGKRISFTRSECDDRALRAYPVHGIRA